MSIINNKIHEDTKITILALSWRDIKAPKAGGAEVHTHEMLKRINKSKYRVIHFSPKVNNMNNKELIDGVLYLRAGNIITVIFCAMFFYCINRKRIDYVIDQCNTHRFFTPFWVKRKKRIFYIHQLTKEIWEYCAKFPLNKIGKAMEEWMINIYKNDVTITVSQSTKDELVQRGFCAEKIVVIYNGVSFEPWSEDRWCVKEENPTFIYAGRYAPYKGIDAAINAYAKVKLSESFIKLWIIGKKDTKYVQENILPICDKYNLKWLDYDGESKDKVDEADIISWGYVSEDEKLDLLSKSWALVFPSIREGWGIPITEAGCVGTPSIVYNSSGIREAVNYGKAGYVCSENNSDALAMQMKTVIDDKGRYLKMQRKAYEYSKQFIWDETGEKLDGFIEKLKVIK